MRRHRRSWQSNKRFHRKFAQKSKPEAQIKIPVEISTNETKENSERVDSKIAIKVKNKDEWITYEYNVSDAPITIGRSHSSININNNSISKEHG